MSESFLLFFSKNFIVLALVIGPLICFELILHGVREGSDFLSWALGSPVFSPHIQADPREQWEMLGWAGEPPLCPRTWLDVCSARSSQAWVRLRRLWRSAWGFLGFTADVPSVLSGVTAWPHVRPSGCMSACVASCLSVGALAPSRKPPLHPLCFCRLVSICRSASCSEVAVPVSLPIWAQASLVKPPLKPFCPKSLCHWSLHHHRHEDCRWAQRCIQLPLGDPGDWAWCGHGT